MKFFCPSMLACQMALAIFSVAASFRSSSSSSSTSSPTSTSSASSSSASHFPYLPRLPFSHPFSFPSPSFHSLSSLPGWPAWTRPLTSPRRVYEYLSRLSDRRPRWWHRSEEAINRIDAPNICFDSYGCFSLASPFAHHRLLPQNPDEVKVQYFVNGPGVEDPKSALRFPANLSFPAEFVSLIRDSPKLVILIHGFLNGAEEPWLQDLVKGLHRRNESLTIVRLGWSTTHSDFNYFQAAANTRLVGRILANFLAAILEDEGSNFSPSSVHLIGHSLGAHVAGFAGKEVSLKKIGKLGRITGLDPAGPLFEGYSPLARLDKDDALLVDVIHTNGISLSRGGFGMTSPIGHLNFYPNGGLTQPGCEGGLHWMFDARFRFCSHGRAVDYFLESVKGESRFSAVECPSYQNFRDGKCKSCFATGACVSMGYEAERPTLLWKRGSLSSSSSSSSSPSSLTNIEKDNLSLFLNTYDSAPFAANHYFDCRIHLATRDAFGYVFVQFDAADDAEDAHRNVVIPISVTPTRLRSSYLLSAFRLLPRGLAIPTKISRLRIKFVCALPPEMLLGRRDDISVNYVKIHVTDFQADSNKPVFYSNFDKRRISDEWTDAINF